MENLFGELLTALRKAEDGRLERDAGGGGEFLILYFLSQLTERTPADGSSSESIWREKVLSLVSYLEQQPPAAAAAERAIVLDVTNQLEDSYAEVRALRDIQGTLEMELDRSRNSLRDAIRSAGQGSDPGKRGEQNRQPTSGRGRIKELEKSLEIERIQHNREATPESPATFDS